MYVAGIAAVNSVVYLAAVLAVIPRNTPRRRRIRLRLIIFAASFPLWLFPWFLLSEQATSAIGSLYGLEAREIVTGVLTSIVPPVVVLLIAGPRRAFLASLVLFAAAVVHGFMWVSSVELFASLSVWHIFNIGAVYLIRRETYEPWLEDRHHPTCPKCGYSLIGLESPRCPECGVPIAT